jgi:hypothetical protein
MFRTIVLSALLGVIQSALADSPEIAIRQITFGPKHHFFGYIGQCKTIPWNASGRYILALQTDFQDRMPTASDAAAIVLLDTQQNYKPIVIEHTRGWNPQQGTMFYWNPLAPETQFFFNDRDPVTGKVFAVLYDISGGLPGKRIREFRFDDTPVGNSGVAQNGGKFLAINYARMARLRPVTGYPEAFDWTVDEKHPDNDGIFKIDVASGRKDLLVSFKQLRDALVVKHPNVNDKALFINHTLWSRNDDLIYFYVRGDFDKKDRINQPFTIRPDGTGLTPLAVFIGGHPEWAPGHQVIGCKDKKQVIYDVDQRKIVRTLGDRSVFPDAEGDIALSPDGQWLANGYREKAISKYVFYRMDGGEIRNVTAFEQTGYTSGDLRVDPSPAWNREGTQILFPSLSNDAEHTRQMFIVELGPRS